MHSSRILVFSTYPVRNPRHGGQFRAEALLSAYQQFGKVKYVAICNSAVYSSKDCSKWDIRVPGNLQQEIESSPSREPVLIGQFATTNTELNGRIQEIISSFSPQIIVLEQPYLWPAVKKAISKLAISKPQIIYSSHNFEVEHFQHFSSTNSSIELDRNWVITSEQDLVKTCSLLIVTTPEDLNKYSEYKQLSEIALVNNGYSPHPSKKVSRPTFKINSEIKFKKFALFVASAHKPNIDGFLEYIGTRLGYFPPETGILIVGTAGPVIGNLVSKKETEWIDQFWNKTQIWGFASEDELISIMEVADLIVLPIQDGGGSNLKTALALSSGKPIVATSHAFRGFKEYATEKNISIQNSAPTFQHCILELLTKAQVTELRNNTYPDWNFNGLFQKMSVIQHSL